MRRQTLAALMAGLSAVALFLAAPTSVRAQIAGENVNMVTGTGWPGGDPYLQRQNEPSIAVSSANPQHLLAGANDYRSVDIPNSWNPGEKMAGDAWVGVFKSLDGGQTWKSYLLPGFPQEKPRIANSKLYVCGTDKATGKAVPCTSAADPIVRAGPDGMFYFGGIVFNRSAIPATALGNYGKVFLTRYIDLNNKEDGNAAASATTATDPIRYVDQKEVALGGPNDFVDKPWIAVDVPRSTATCKIALPDGTSRTVAAHTVYVAYLRIVSSTQSDVMVRHSDDCGSSWSSAVKVSDASTLANEGPSLAIDPVKGHVYVTWRRMAGLNSGQGDAIMLSRSFSRANRFTKPRLVATVTPFDQPTSPTTSLPDNQTFRVTVFPTSAISIDTAGVRRLHVAWSDRAGGAPLGDSRVVVATKRLSPPPVTEYEPDEDDNTCQRLDAPRPADGRPVTADGEPLKFPGNAGVEFATGHQFMPALTFSQGRLMLVYYDSRMDHARAYHEPHTTACVDDRLGKCWMTPTTSCDSDGSGRCWTLNAEGSYYDVVRGPWGAPVVGADGINGPETLTDDAGQVFTGFLDERTLRNVRHTVDVRVASAPPGDAPDFSSAPLSRFPFGTRGDEGFLASRDAAGGLKLPGYGTTSWAVQPDAVTLVETPAGGKMTLRRLQQLKMNPPNLPIFRNGTVPFLGDYIDIQGPAFVKKAGKWAFNLDPTSSPVFHAVWTTNEDVRAPLDGDWSKYVPINTNGATTSTWNGEARTACDPLASPNDVFYTASRNQNVYTARITEGLAVFSPQNVKPLSSTLVRSFVIAATNASSAPMTTTWTFTRPSGTTASFKMASPDQIDTTVTSLTVVIGPHATASRTLFVKSTSATASLTVNVVAAGGASGFVVLNPPGLVPGVVSPPDSCTGPAAICAPLASGESYTSIQVAANLSNANLSNANLSNANLSNANLSNANLSNANLSNANLSNANLSNAALANLSNANLSNANLSNANLSNANLSNANLSNANLSNANLSNASVSDLNYEYRNDGNTTTTYAVKIVGEKPRANEVLQLILAKTYTTPTAVGCALREEPHNHILASIDRINDAIITDPNTPVDPGVTDPAITNATLTLAPGERAQITLRGNVTLGRMAEIGATLQPVPLAQRTPGGFAGNGTFGDLVWARIWTWTDLQYDAIDHFFTATVHEDGSPKVTAGSVTFVANGTILIGTVPVDANGVATMSSAGVPAGATVVAYYSGSSNWLPSSGSVTVLGSHWTPLAPVPATMDAMPDRGVAALNGQILLFGGDVGDGYGDAVSRFDPATGSWAALGALAQPVLPGGTILSFGHAATRAANVGGRMFSVSYWYDPSPDGYDYLSIEEWNASGSLGIVKLITSSGLRWPEAAAGLDGKLFVVGGSWSDGTGFTTVIWNPATDATSVESGGMSSGVAAYSVVAANGKLHLLGGAVPSYCDWDYSAYPATCVPHEFPSSNVWWTYTPGVPTGTWTLNDYASVYMPTPRHSLGAAVLGGKIYAIGGNAGPTWFLNAVNTVEVFDPVAETWAPADPNLDMNIARFRHSVVEVGGRIYAIGGHATPRAVGVFIP